jgi:hypothetical protein
MIDARLDGDLSWSVFVRDEPTAFRWPSPQAVFARILKALHESRQKTADREIARYRHLICTRDDAPRGS